MDKQGNFRIAIYNFNSKLFNKLKLSLIKRVRNVLTNRIYEIYKDAEMDQKNKAITISDKLKSLLSRKSRVVVLTGAGISAESGVPTFRGEEGL
jgi:hypothetical protein